MAGYVVVLIVVTVIVGACAGAFVRLSLAIRWEDRRRGSLSYDAPSPTTRAARTLVGISESGWE